MDNLKKKIFKVNYLWYWVAIRVALGFQFFLK